MEILTKVSDFDIKTIDKLYIFNKNLALAANARDDKSNQELEEAEQVREMIEVSFSMCEYCGQLSR